MGFVEVLTIVFIILKLLGIIDWAWWLVLLPEIIMIAMYVVITIIWFALNISARRKRGKRR